MEPELIDQLNAEAKTNPGENPNMKWNCPGCGVVVGYDRERFLRNFLLWNTCSVCGIRYTVTLCGDE